MRSITALCILVVTSLHAACGDDDDDSSPAPDAGADTGSGADSGTDAGPGSPLLVETAEGPLRGSSADGARAFLGIPFAAPPTGPRRWMPPAPVDPWADERDATVRGAPCPQNALIGGSWVEDSAEDCLTLNVWAPDPAPAAPRPVLVWFHGGCFLSCCGGDRNLHGARLTRRAGRRALVTMACSISAPRCSGCGGTSRPSAETRPT